MVRCSAGVAGNAVSGAAIGRSGTIENALRPPHELFFHVDMRNKDEKQTLNLVNATFTGPSLERNKAGTRPEQRRNKLDTLTDEIRGNLLRCYNLEAF